MQGKCVIDDYGECRSKSRKTVMAVEMTELAKENLLVCFFTA